MPFSYNLIRFAIIALSFLLPLAGNAQVLSPYKVIDLGAGANLIFAATDAETSKNATAIHVNFNYNIDFHTAFIAQIEFGKIEGGDSVNTWSGRQFTNQFKSFCFRGQMQLGKLFSNSPEAFQRVYLSSGIGGISNDIIKINRNSLLLPGYTSPGKNQSINFFVPLRLGYELPILNAYKAAKVKIDVAYQLNIILGDDIDGFAAGKISDKLSQLSVGLKVPLFGRRW